MPRTVRLAAVLAACLCGAGPALSANLAPGDLVVVDNQTGAVIQVDPSSGAQTLLLNGSSFTDIATAENGRFAATFIGPVGSGVGEIDPVAATFTPLAPGGNWSTPMGVAAGKAGHLLVADEFVFVGCSTGGTVFDVNAASGTQTVALCVHAHPLDVALESSDSVVIASQNLGVVRFDPVTKVGRDLASPTPIFHPDDIALASDGTIYTVAHANGSADIYIYRVDPITGAVTMISSGAQFVNLTGIAVAPNGDLLVTDADALPDGAGAKGAVFRVNPATAAQTVVSSGGMFRSLSGIAIAGVRNGTVPTRRGTWGGVKARYR
jgi:sugar lactone lactonase YvrE